MSKYLIPALKMNGASWLRKLIVFSCYVIAGVFVIDFIIPPTEWYEPLAVLVSTCVVGGLVWKQHAFLSKQTPQPNTSSITVEEVKDIKLSPVFHGRVRSILDEARSNAFTFLHPKYPQLADAHVRANIFFPSHSVSASRDNYALKIYPGLCLNMTLPDEVNICFNPGQGATGKVFESGVARVTKRLSNDSGNWDETLEITDELAKVIHPDLKWIISMPIKGKAHKPIGVLNIDGLCEDCNEQDLYDCMGRTTVQVVVIGKLVE